MEYLIFNMRSSTFFLLILFSCVTGLSQSNPHKDVLIQSKIDSVKRSKVFASDTLEYLFRIDTFRIEIKEEVYLEDAKNDYVMQDIVNQAGRSYDALLNKYYKKLYAKLKDSDRAVLVRTQKAWISFRDEELKLYDAINTASNGGGGSASTVAFASIYCNLTKQRTIDIFNYYRDLTYRY